MRQDVTAAEALRMVLDATPVLGAETVAIAAALGRVLCEPIDAGRDLPPDANSAMDGYAVRAEDTSRATPEHPVVLPVAEDIPAGRTDELTLQPGTAHRIMTGAPLPAGATAVVPVEDTDGGVETVSIRAPREATNERPPPEIPP